MTKPVYLQRVYSKGGGQPLRISNIFKWDGHHWYWRPPSNQGKWRELQELTSPRTSKKLNEARERGYSTEDHLSPYILHRITEEETAMIIFEAKD